MAWRVMRSLLILRDQVNLIAPDRAKGADGTICDTNHPTTSDHCPHYVKDVGPEMVTALDLTHDPAGGFDSYQFAEVLCIHRDKRIKYVISNHRIFDTSGTDAWVWRPYSGVDPHTNHVHISVLDAPISDTDTQWNLEGFDDMDWYDRVPPGSTDNNNRTYSQCLTDVENLRNWLVGTEGSAPGPGAPGAMSREMLLHTRVHLIEEQLDAMDKKLDAILLKLAQGGGGAPFPVSSGFTMTSGGTVVWDQPVQ